MACDAGSHVAGPMLVDKVIASSRSTKKCGCMPDLSSCIRRASQALKLARLCMLRSRASCSATPWHHVCVCMGCVCRLHSLQFHLRHVRLRRAQTRQAATSTLAMVAGFGQDGARHGGKHPHHEQHTFPAASTPARPTGASCPILGPSTGGRVVPCFHSSVGGRRGLSAANVCARTARRVGLRAPAGRRCKTAVQAPWRGTWGRLPFGHAEG